MKKTYSDLLKAPRWQKKRLEILSRDSFTCRACGRDDETLHVHHTYYDNDLLPWEYENEDLVTLCETCHEVWSLIDRMLKNTNYGWEHISTVVRLYDKMEYDSINEFLKKRELEKLSGVLEDESDFFKESANE